ncbi:MAG: glutamyl-tRNA reductase [Cyclobacteriaceae bacterium]|nr:glutamyl-tRNA reductase [Flammeovirgaceae bacterium]MDG1105266.1 glutamyl-tRNA reductase [Cyclobacteriaceae bacterium]
MYESLKVVGLSYDSSPIAIRESVAFSENESRIFLDRMREILGTEEALILSTCNRTEIYYTSDFDLSNAILNLLKTEKGVDHGIDSYFWNKEKLPALRHLFRVALGLEAKVLGDIQISNQVKKAYQCSADQHLSGPFFHRLMHTIFYANKRVVQETVFRDGAASVSYACVGLVQQFIQNFSDPQILVLGLGEIGRDVADNLEEMNASITLSNRNALTTQTLAKRYGYEVLPFGELLKNIAKFDVIISSVQVPKPLIRKDHIPEQLLSQKLFVDLAMPRSMDSELDTIDGIILYNVDQIEEQTSGIIERRRAAITEVELIVDETIEELKNWSLEMEVSPTIKKLKNALEEIRKEEIARYVGKITEVEQDLIDKVTKRIVQKVIKLPVLQLKAACKRGEAETLVEVLNDLFNLEKDELTPKK